MVRAIQFVIFSLFLQYVLASNLDTVKDILKTNARNNLDKTQHTWLSWEDLQNVSSTFEITDIKAHLNIKFVTRNSDIVQANFNKQRKFSFITQEVRKEVTKRHNLKNYTNCTKIKFFPIEKKVQFHFHFGENFDDRVIELPIKRFAIRKIEGVLQLDQYIQI